MKKRLRGMESARLYYYMCRMARETFKGLVNQFDCTAISDGVDFPNSRKRL